MAFNFNVRALTGISPGNAFGLNIGPTKVKIPGLNITVDLFGPGPTNPDATQQFSIENFRQNLNRHNETARTDKFDVWMSPPQNVAAYAGISPADAMRGISLQCEVSELPGRDVQMAEYRLHAILERVPHNNQFGQASFTFICTGDMWEKKLFESWIDFMLPAQTGLANYPLDSRGHRNYECDILCNQYNSMGEPMYAAMLVDAVPVSMSPLNQSWDNDSIHRLTVQFQFRKWLSGSTTFNQTTISTSSNGGVPLPISTNPTTPVAATDQRITQIQKAVLPKPASPTSILNPGVGPLPQAPQNDILNSLSVGALGGG